VKRIATLGFLLLLWTPAFAGKESPLADAAERSDRAAVRAHLKRRADVNAPQADGMTALHWAVRLDDFETAKALVEAKANASATNRYGVTPLSLACMNGNTAIVELLLEHGADPNTTLHGGETALMTASRTGKPGPVKALLKRGGNLNARERGGQTALMWAAADGNTEVVDTSFLRRARGPDGNSSCLAQSRCGRARGGGTTQAGGQRSSQRNQRADSCHREWPLRTGTGFD
jgi:ankyrin repeat protein